MSGLPKRFPDRVSIAAVRKLAEKKQSNQFMGTTRRVAGRVMALRDLGWPGFMQVLLFVLMLLAGYVYVWRKGALDWSAEH